MQPGYRTLARSRPQNALDTLFADEEARTVAAKESPAPSRPPDDLDLQFAEERSAPRKPATRSTRPALFGSSPYVVVALVTLFSVASPLLFSQRQVPEESRPLPSVDLPVATTSEPITLPPAPAPSTPVTPATANATPRPTREAARAPASSTATRTRPTVTPPPPPTRTLTPPPSSRLVSTPTRSAVIPTVQLASRTSETLGALPESAVSAPAPPPPPPVVHARSTEPVAEPVDQRAGVMATLRRYEAAYSALDARAVRTVWPSVNQGALSRAFDSLASQTIRLGNCNVTVRAPTARAVCAGTATWAPRIGGGREHQDRRTWTFSLAQRDQSWAIVSAEMR